MTDLATWWHDEGSECFYKFVKYKKVWTPYELEEKFSDTSMYENDGYYTIVKIKNLIEIPNDILIEYQEYFEDGLGNLEKTNIIGYVKLSDISLSRFNLDGIYRIIEDKENKEEQEEN